jgi:hypothetical protein
VGTEGQLLAPIDSVVGGYDPTAFRKSWVVGDGGPVEASWWNSSAYPFAVMRLLALTRPAKFFALFADRDRYKFNIDFTRGRVSNLISSSALASDLAAVMLDDKATKEILDGGEFVVSLNTKFQILIKSTTPAATEE